MLRDFLGNLPTRNAGSRGGDQGRRQQQSPFVERLILGPGRSSCAHGHSDDLAQDITGSHRWGVDPDSSSMMYPSLGGRKSHPSCSVAAQGGIRSSGLGRGGGGGGSGGSSGTTTVVTRRAVDSTSGFGGTGGNGSGGFCSGRVQGGPRRSVKRSAYKHVPHREKPPHLVARRNARERRRVQAVNGAFVRLRRHIPYGNNNKRLSKVKTLRIAIDYITQLQKMIDEHDGSKAEPFTCSHRRNLPLQQPQPIHHPHQHQHHHHPRHQQTEIFNSTGKWTQIQQQQQNYGL